MSDVLAMRRGTNRAFPPGCVFWVVFVGEGMLARPLTLHTERGEETLAVFGHEEEAEMFVRLSGEVGESWRARETSAGEVVSLLYGPCCKAKSVALDPLPRMLTDGSLTLVTLGRGRFVERITKRGLGPATLLDAEPTTVGEPG